MMFFLRYFLIFSLIFYFLLIVKRQIFPSNIFFYESLILLAFTSFLFLLYFLYKKIFMKKIINKDIFLLTILFGIFFNYSIIITGPALSNRSLSLYILETIGKNNDNNGITQDKILLSLQKNFLVEKKQLENRLYEQISSKNIYKKDEVFFISTRGKIINIINEIFLKIFNL